MLGDIIQYVSIAYRGVTVLKPYALKGNRYVQPSFDQLGRSLGDELHEALILWRWCATEEPRLKALANEVLISFCNLSCSAASASYYTIR